MIQNYVFFLNSFSFLIISIISFITFLACYIKKICRIGRLSGFVSFLNLIMFFLTLFWAFGVLPAIEFHILFIYSLFILINAVLILLISYRLTNNRNHFYLLLLFLPVVLTFNLGIDNFFIFSILLSSLFMVFLFFNLSRFVGFQLNKVGIFGIIYSYFLILFLVYSLNNLVNFFWFLPNIVMFLVFYYFNMEINSCSMVLSKQEEKIKKTNLFFQSIRFLTFIISMILFVMFSAIALHEIGHSLAAYSFGCTNVKAIIFEPTKWPHTELRCDTAGTARIIIILSGIFMVAAISLILFFINAGFTRDISYLLFGFSLLSAYDDLGSLFLSKTLLMVIFIVSLCIILFAVIKLALAYQNIMQSELFCIGKKEKQNPP
jgi:hypothetical protein